MNRAKYLIVAAIIVLVMAVTVGPAAAQSGSPVTAQVDRNSLTTDDVLSLVIAIDSSAGDASQPQLPPLVGFQVLASSRSSQMSAINGKMSWSTNYQYTLRPTQTGDLVIGPVTVNTSGGSYTTNPIKVQVSQGNGQPTAPSQPNSAFPSLPGFGNLGNFGSLGNLGSLGGFGSLPNLGSLLGQATTPNAPSIPVVPIDPAPVPADLEGQDLFLEAVVDNPTPYQGQQVLYNVRLYQAIQGVGTVDYGAPTFTGFWSEQQPEQGEYMIQAAGRNYRVAQLTTVLFPTVVGEVTIDPATISVPGDFFSRPAELTSQPVKLNVQSLPDTAPAGFQGAVGRFDIQAEVDKSETEIDDTVNWHVVLSGQGNIDNLPEPEWNESQAWRAFDSEAVVDRRFEESVMTGSRTYDRVLVPTEAGELTLPAVAYSYFDPELGEYVTIETQPLSVNVAPGTTNPANVPTLPAGGPAATAPLGTNMPGELRPLKEAPTSWSTGSPWLTDKAGFWLLWLAPLAVLAGHFAWQRRQDIRLNNASSRRSKQAAGKARNALRVARKDKSKDNYQACGQILTTYLSEKMGRSFSGMTQNGVSSILIQEGVAPELAGRVERCLMLTEMGRYAPADLYRADSDLLAETESLVNDLDQVL